MAMSEMDYMNVGGGIDPNLVVAYKDGEWQNGFSATDFKYNNGSQQSDHIAIVGSAGDGIYCQTDYSSQYIGVRIAYTTTNTNVSRYNQSGTCTTSASLPSIINSGSGRYDYMECNAVFSEEQQIGITLSSGRGFFFGCQSNSYPIKIKAIYFVKSN